MKTPTPTRTQQETRMIMIRITILAFILFFNSITTAFLDTFLPDMMIIFGVVKTKSEAGKYASWIFTFFFIGRFLTAGLWGAFIDKHGRKKGLLIALSLLSLCTLLFGLSSNLYYALLIRFFTGAFNGLSIIGKTLSTEICPSDLKPWSISVTNTIWSLGMTIGPIIGSTTFNKIESFPILAPSLAVCAIGMTLFVLTMIFIEETLEETPKKDQNGFAPATQLDKENTIDEHHDEGIAEATGTANKMAQGKLELVSHQGNSPAQTSSTMFGIGEILAIPNVLRIIIIFSTNTFYASVLVGLIPFWIASSYEDGGLDFKYHDISDIFVYLTLPQLLLQIVLYPMIQKRRGDFWLLTRGHYAHLPLFFFLPYAHFFGKGSFTAQKGWITFWLFIRNLASFMNFAVLQRYGNDIISAQKRGKMNGIQITCSSMFQIFGTFLGGFLLSWSETNGLPFPFNYHFVFLVMCIVTVGIIFVIYGIRFADSLKTKILGEETVAH